MKKLFHALSLIFPLLPVTAQADTLLPIEKFAFSSTLNQSITPMDIEIGLLDGKAPIQELLTEFFEGGPDPAFCDEEMLYVLDEKFKLINQGQEPVKDLRISKRRDDEERYEGKFKFTRGGNIIKGTVYLVKNKDKWFLYDYELENQEISSP